MTTRKIRPAFQLDPNPVQEVCNFSKIQLIRKFQRIEGNIDCFASAHTRACEQFECLWRDECLIQAADEAQSGHD